MLWSRGTFGASAPVDDFGFVDLVAGVIAGRQARGIADRTVDIGDGTARPTHDVVVVVFDPELIARHGVAWLDAPYQACSSKLAPVHGRKRSVPSVQSVRALNAYDQSSLSGKSPRMPTAAVTRAASSVAAATRFAA